VIPRSLVPLLLAPLLLLASCATDTAAEPPAAGPTSSGSGDADADARVTGTASRAAGTEVAAVYDFSGTTIDGGSFEGSSLQGAPAVLWFWAPWCPTCRGQVDGVTALAERHDGEVSVIGVGGLDDAGAIADFAEEHDMGIPHLQDPDGAVWRHFGITAQSAYVVLDADGVVVAEGSLGDEELAAEVAELVG